MPLTLSAEDMAAGVDRLAEAIRDKTAGAPIALIGIRRRGDEVAERLADWDACARRARGTCPAVPRR